MALPLELDETEKRLYAEFDKRVCEYAIAEEKLTNPRSMLAACAAEYAKLQKEADAIRDGCDQIRLKIREYKRAKAF
jgi:hypothetical protein